jgi:hypothetical protein
MTRERRLDIGDSGSPGDPTRLDEPHSDEATRVRDEGRALLDAADHAINHALSRNSSQFLAQGRQAGGQ